MSIEDRIRKRKGYTFFRNLFQRLKEMGVEPRTSLEVLRLFHEVIDNLNGYHYAWRAVKNQETLELFTRDFNNGQVLPTVLVPPLVACSGRCSNSYCEHKQPHREKDACRTDRCDRKTGFQRGKQAIGFSGGENCPFAADGNTFAPLGS